MSDELEKLERLFAKQEPGTPDPARKAEALNAAMVAFSKENASLRKGMADEERLTSRGKQDLLQNSWRHLMQTLSLNSGRGLRYALTGGVAASVIGAAVIAVGPTYFSGFIAPETAGPDIGEDAAPMTNTAGPVSAPAEAPPPGARMQPLQVPPASHPSLVTETGRVAVRQRSDKLALQSFNTEGEAGVAAPPVQNRMVASRPSPAAADDVAGGYENANRDSFPKAEPNAVELVSENPVSTFSIDVDTASYGFVRRLLNNGTFPDSSVVRVEELINYFDYDYVPPAAADQPFSVDTAIMPTPWNDQTQILRIGIQGYETTVSERPPANLVFLIDTSGSMNQSDKLPLLKNAFRLLLNTLGENDTVSIVAYAGSAGVVLEPTKISESSDILDALGRLEAGGSTAGGQGIELAYRVAEKHMKDDGINRVILATDGDFNVGISDPEKLEDFIADKRDSGVSLSVLGFGRGNYQDSTMQALAQNGNGNAAYIDTLNEARKVLVEEVNGTLFNIASDVKLQLEFNPAMVTEYRLIGYETRMLRREDFNNDKVDAGEIGAGHTVTALYEITPAGNPGRVDQLRYQSQTQISGGSDSNEYGFLRIRYKQPGETTSELIETPITKDMVFDKIEDAPENARFAVSVAGFGEILRRSTQIGDFGFDDVVALATSAKGADRFGYRAEFLNLVQLAKALGK